MNWKFWKSSSLSNGSTGTKIPRSDRPKELPEPIGRKMVVSLKLDPDVVWTLKYLSRPMENHATVREFRIFDPEKIHRASMAVKGWSSLDDRPDLIMYSGSYDKQADSIEIREGG